MKRHGLLSFLTHMRYAVVVTPRRPAAISCRDTFPCFRAGLTRKLALSSCGAARGIAIVRVSGVGGVMSKPPRMTKEGVITMVPAVVPVCSGIEGFPLNSARVEFAGMVKFTVRPPAAN